MYTPMCIRDQLSDVTKDERVTATLIELERRLGAGAFRIVDHWEADLISIGIAHRTDERLLAYFAVGDADNSYYLELETAPAPECDLPYAVAGRFQNVTFDELAKLIAQHLSIAV